jgi:hypothetical protein
MLMTRNRNVPTVAGTTEPRARPAPPIARTTPFRGKNAPPKGDSSARPDQFQIQGAWEPVEVRGGLADTSKIDFKTHWPLWVFQGNNLTIHSSADPNKDTRQI